MIEKDKNEVKRKKGLRDILVTLAIILLVVSIGVFAVNQVLEYRYRAVFLKAPCHVCAELNKNQSKCINECFIIKKNLYYYNGNWVDDTGKCYTREGIEKDCGTGIFG